MSREDPAVSGSKVVAQQARVPKHSELLLLWKLMAAVDPWGHHHHWEQKKMGEQLLMMIRQ